MANLRNPYNELGQFDEWGQVPDDSWSTGGPVVQADGPATAAPKQDISGSADWLAQAQQAYGGNWDADAQQQFDYRVSQGQGYNDIMTNTAQDAKARFPGQPSGISGSAPQQMPPPNLQMPAKNSALMDSLTNLFSTGGYNQDLVNRRVESANEGLQRQRSSRDKTNRAALASRGLLSEGAGHESGAELTALSKLDQSIADQYSGAVRDIYADESGNADQRMIQALSVAAGLSTQEAQMIIDQFRAETERQLGMGNLALGNMRGVNDYNIALGRLGLDRDVSMAELDNADWDRLLEALKSGIDLNTLSQAGYQ